MSDLIARIMAIDTEWACVAIGFIGAVVVYLSQVAA